MVWRRERRDLLGAVQARVAHAFRVGKSTVYIGGHRTLERDWPSSVFPGDCFDAVLWFIIIPCFSCVLE
jgi:hypothetical protein